MNRTEGWGDFLRQAKLTGDRDLDFFTKADEIAEQEVLASLAGKEMPVKGQQDVEQNLPVGLNKIWRDWVGMSEDDVKNCQDYSVLQPVLNRVQTEIARCRERSDEVAGRLLKKLLAIEQRLLDKKVELKG